mmetsp:Transcript_5074/g.11170  ORF Transcript_5074/g.11170 Transcript_5074/m.11170 type:complete len:339 (+) Transcript_5074:322-1338(+)
MAANHPGFQNFGGLPESEQMPNGQAQRAPIDDSLLTDTNGNFKMFIISKKEGEQGFSEDRIIRNLKLGQIPGNMHFPAGQAFTVVTNEDVGLSKRDPDYYDEFERCGRDLLQGLLILAETRQAFEEWAGDQAAQEEAKLFPNDKVWILTNDGIWPRRGANKAKGKDDGMTYYGQRDPVTGKPNGVGTGYYTNGNKFEGEWSMGKKRGKGIYTYSSGERYEGEMGGNKGYKHGQVSHYSSSTPHSTARPNATTLVPVPHTHAHNSHGSLRPRRGGCTRGTVASKRKGSGSRGISKRRPSPPNPILIRRPTTTGGHQAGSWSRNVRPRNDRQMYRSGHAR